MEELCTTLRRDKRVKIVDIRHRWMALETNDGCPGGCRVAVTLKGDELPYVSRAHCEECWKIFVDIFPPTRSYLQRQVCMDKIGCCDVRESSCVVCYRYARTATAGSGYCAMCKSRHTMETGLMIYKWFLCREAMACDDVARIVMGLVVMC